MCSRRPFDASTTTHSAPDSRHCSPRATSVSSRDASSFEITTTETWLIGKVLQISVTKPGSCCDRSSKLRSRGRCVEYILACCEEAHVRWCRPTRCRDQVGRCLRPIDGREATGAVPRGVALHLSGPRDRRRSAVTDEAGNC